MRLKIFWNLNWNGAALQRDMGELGPGSLDGLSKAGLPMASSPAAGMKKYLLHTVLVQGLGGYHFHPQQFLYA